MAQNSVLSEKLSPEPFHVENGKKKRKKIEPTRVWFMIAFLAIPTINFCVFFIYTNIDAFFMSFQKPTYVDGSLTLEWTLEQYQKVFSDFMNNGILWLALKNTLSYYVVGTFITFPLSVLLTYFIYKQIAGFRIFRFIFYLPTIITSAAMAMLVKYSLQTGGPVANIVESFGGTWTYPYTDPTRAHPTMLLQGVLFGLGGSLVLYGGAMNAINKEMLEAGELDGCTWFTELIYLVIPSIWPTMSTSLILGLAGILGSGGSILVYTKGSYNTMTLSFMLYDLVAGISGTKDLHYASAVGMVMTLMIFPVVMFVRWYIYGRKEKD